VLDVSRGLEAFVALAESLDEPVFVWKASGEMLWTNQAFVRETGMTVEDFRFQNPDNPFIHPDDLPRVLAELTAFMESDALRSPPIENRFTDIWGRVRGLSSRVHKVLWEGESALLLVSSLKTGVVTEADASYRRLVESADDGILKLARDGRIVYSNRRFHELVRGTPVQLAKQRLQELVAAEDRSAAERALQQLQAGAARVGFEARVPCEGEELWLDISLSPIDDANGGGDYLGIARDVTHTRRLEEKLRQSQKLESLGTLAGGIAHDFNNIVTGVLANATLAEAMTDKASGVAEVVHDIRLAAERAAALNASLLAYVGQAPTAVETFDLRDRAKESVHMLRPLLSKAVRIELSPASTPALVRADPGQLSQVLVNLITNAAQAIDESGGLVEVQTGVLQFTADAGPHSWLPAVPTSGQYAFLRVVDDGQGMSHAVLERIFDPFFTTKGLGRGLGLSATIGIVRRHGGALRIDSEPGRGTRFEVLLPLCENREEERKLPATTRTGPESGVVLFCDDEQLIRQLGKRILEREGYEVVLVATGEQALAELDADRDRFSVLVVDHSLPGLRGDKVAARARELRPDLPIVKASGYRDVFDEAEAPGTVFLPKPYTRTALIDSVQAAMRNVER
jgi:two-component system, chemotaxis family, CheB/CheR fusion protein